MTNKFFNAISSQNLTDKTVIFILSHKRFDHQTLNEISGVETTLS